MFILLTLGLFLLKFLAIGVVGLFFLEDLELTRSIGSLPYSVYFFLGACTFLALFLFVLGKKLLWLIIFLVSGFLYAAMYNHAPDIKEIHQQNDLKSRYFKDSATFLSRMADVITALSKKQQGE